MDFSDSDHSAAEITYQGSHRHSPQDRCHETLLAALDRWQSRARAADPASSVFHFPNTQCFVLTYRGEASDYWPNEEVNWLSESLVRDFLFEHGICTIDSYEPVLFEVHYKVQALEGIEYLLVCPYPTPDGNMGGILVICANHLVATEPSLN